jgi:HTH-type transcriptional regulator/antitoxin MqsA
VAFSRYENDDVTQSEAMDSLVRICLEQPASLVRMAEFKGIRSGVMPSRRASVDNIAYDRILAMKRSLERQIGPDSATQGPAEGGGARHPRVVDIQRWRKSVA